MLILLIAPTVSLFTLSALFAEPRVGKARAKRLEEESRSCRDCRLVYSPGWHGSHNTASLLADAAAGAAATTQP